MKIEIKYTLKEHEEVPQELLNELSMRLNKAVWDNFNDLLTGGNVKVENNWPNVRFTNTLVGVIDANQP